MTHEYSAHSRHDYCRHCKQTKEAHAIMTDNDTSWTATIAAARATVTNGGGTFNARTMEPHAPTTGYAIGLGDGSKVVASATSTDIAVAIYRAAQSHKSAPFIGTWIDDGVIYIDPVVILASREDALTLARALGELAIYSFADNESVTA